jgi:hypothetical protein
MSNPELTRAAIEAFESAKQLADTVAHFFPDEGDPICEDLEDFALRVELDMAHHQANSSTPPSTETRRLSAFLHETSRPARRRSGGSVSLPPEFLEAPKLVSNAS